jgi:uncharacterized protein YjbI with pentapeptide repeats
LDSDSNGNSNNNDVKKALVIAVSDYSDSSGLKSIEFCKNDGQEIYNVLKKNGYDIPDNHRLIGHVDSAKLKEIIYDFFTDDNNNPDDTLVFYYSGHGVPDKFGRTFLAPSNINSEHPFKTGYSFDDLTDAMLSCNSLRIVTILDCCYSGALKIGKGLGSDLDTKGVEDATTLIAKKIVEEKSNKLRQGIGRCLLASSQGYEEAYERQEKDHSVFTYYLLEGLRGHKNALDDEGNVTYHSLGKFIAREMGNLPPDKRPKQTPIQKGEFSGGEIILTYYPERRKFSKEEFIETLIQFLRKGQVDGFNTMRMKVPHDIFLDFSSQKLQGVKLNGANLSSINLSRSNLTYAHLEGSNLTNANLFRADLEGANLQNIIAKEGLMEEAILVKCTLTNANLSNANLSNANLSNANLSNANLSNANLSNANLSNANLSKSNLSGANLRQAKLVRSNLIDAHISETNIHEADTTNAILFENNESKTSLFKDLDSKLGNKSKGTDPRFIEDAQPPGKIDPGEKEVYKSKLTKLAKISAIGVAILVITYVVLMLIVPTDVNSPPRVFDSSVNTSIGQPVIVQLKVLDTDAKDDLTASIIVGPSHGVLSTVNQAIGTVIYTPNSGYSGNDKFTYKVYDGQASSEAGTVNIIVGRH